MITYKTIFMPGTKPGDRFSSPDGVGVQHFAAFLDAELKKGKAIEVVKAIVQTEHTCMLNGVPVVFREGLTYDIPKDLAEILAAKKIVVIDPAIPPRVAKYEAQETKIKMLSTAKSSLDGISVREFMAGEIYALPKTKAEAFVNAGWAELVKDTAETGSSDPSKKSNKEEKHD